MGRERSAARARQLGADAAVALLPVAGATDVVEVEQPAILGEQRVDVAVAARKRLRREVVERTRADDDVRLLDPRRPEGLGCTDDERDPVAEFHERLARPL